MALRPAADGPRAWNRWPSPKSGSAPILLASFATTSGPRVQRAVAGRRPAAGPRRPRRTLGNHQHATLDQRRLAERLSPKALCPGG